MDSHTEIVLEAEPDIKVDEFAAEQTIARILPFSFAKRHGVLIRDFEELFKESPFDSTLYPEAFSSKYAHWTKIFLKTPWLKEFITAYIWVVLTKN